MHDRQPRNPVRTASPARIAAMWLIGRAMGSAVLARDYHLIHEDKGSHHRLWLVHRDDRKKALTVVGDMIFQWKAACKGFAVKEVTAQHGFGPLLYDAAMEAIHPKYLGSDEPFKVSMEAERIWKFYAEGRSDVERKPRTDPMPPPPRLPKAEIERVVDALLEGRLDLKRWLSGLEFHSPDDRGRTEANLQRFLGGGGPLSTMDRYNLVQDVGNILGYDQGKRHRKRVEESATGGCEDHHKPFLNWLFRKKPGAIKRHIVSLREFNQDPRIVATFGGPLTVTNPEKLDSVEPEFPDYAEMRA